MHLINTETGSGMCIEKDKLRHNALIVKSDMVGKAGFVPQDATNFNTLQRDLLFRAVRVCYLRAKTTKTH